MFKWDGRKMEPNHIHMGMESIKFMVVNYSFSVSFVFKLAICIDAEPTCTTWFADRVVIPTMSTKGICQICRRLWPKVRSILWPLYKSMGGMPLPTALVYQSIHLIHSQICLSVSLLKIQALFLIKWPLQHPFQVIWCHQRQQTDSEQ